MNKSITFLITLILIAGIIFGVSKMTGNTINSKDSNKATIETNYGNIVVQLNPDEAPITVQNFKTYVNESFYDNTLFHRVIDGFMIQGGGFDATSGQEKQTHDSIKLESNNGLKNDRGTLAMARTNIPDSATSQFFINTQNNDFLNYASPANPGYAVFGKVIEGMDVVDKISKVQTDSNDKPLEDVVIKSVSFVR